MCTNVVAIQSAVTLPTAILSLLQGRNKVTILVIKKASVGSVWRAIILVIIETVLRAMYVDRHYIYCMGCHNVHIEANILVIKYATVVAIRLASVLVKYIGYNGGHTYG